jgi:hypothetical protein
LILRNEWHKIDQEADHNSCGPVNSETAQQIQVAIAVAVAVAVAVAEAVGVGVGLAEAAIIAAQRSAEKACTRRNDGSSDEYRRRRFVGRVCSASRPGRSGDGTWFMDP